MKVTYEWSGQEIRLAFLKQVISKSWWNPFRRDTVISNVHTECSNCGKHENIDSLKVLIDVEVNMNDARKSD